MEMKCHLKRLFAVICRTTRVAKPVFLRTNVQTRDHLPVAQCSEANLLTSEGRNLTCIRHADSQITPEE